MSKCTFADAKALFGDNMLGPLELAPMFEKMGLKDDVADTAEIPYSKEQLASLAKDYILVYAVDKVGDTIVNINLFRDIFGFDPDVSEPCLYNQDWYMAENFIRQPIRAGWHLIKKEVFEDSRAVMPSNLLERNIKFPTAILCIYTFFAYFFAYGKMLWYHDFVWCCDIDHNGDRIYVGKYHDIDGVNKNGFSIHRHLALRMCYGSSNVL